MRKTKIIACFVSIALLGFMSACSQASGQAPQNAEHRQQTSPYVTTLLAPDSIPTEQTTIEREPSDDKVSDEINKNEDPIHDLIPTSFSLINNLENVTMYIVEDSVFASGLCLIIDNKSNNEYLYGAYYVLEFMKDGLWYIYPVAIREPYGFPSIGYPLGAKAQRSWEVDWEWLYGKLPVGEYRIVKDILDVRGMGNYDTYYLSAEFVIK